MGLVSRFYRIMRAKLGSLTELDLDPGTSSGGAYGPRTHAPPPPAEPPRDERIAGYYANLELPYGADLEAVRAARKRMVKRYHPDLHSRNEQKRLLATELVKRLNRAHDELTRHLEASS